MCGRGLGRAGVASTKGRAGATEASGGAMSVPPPCAAISGRGLDLRGAYLLAEDISRGREARAVPCIVLRLSATTAPLGTNALSTGVESLPVPPPVPEFEYIAMSTLPTSEGTANVVVAGADARRPQSADTGTSAALAVPPPWTIHCQCARVCPAARVGAAASTRTGGTGSFCLFRGDGVGTAACTCGGGYDDRGLLAGRHSHPRTPQRRYRHSGNIAPRTNTK